jgi:GDP-4-dehydro-6-deoxy-D-mannose reductase
MNVMITGAAGFIGGFLAEHTLQAGASLLGIGVTNPPTWTGGAFELCDVRDEKRITHLLSTFRPDRIFHLAAQSYPTVSLVQPRETMDINAGGTINLFECARSAGIAPVVVVACSSAEYGFVEAQDLPVRETHPLRPLHPYGVSKVAQDLLAAQYFATYALPTVRIRIFNTTGPGKLGDVCSDLARRAVEIELGMRPPSLQVGAITKRAIIDARDLVRGLWMSPECCTMGDVYNLGATQIYSIQEVIDNIRAQAKTPFTIEQSPALMRPCDEPVIAGDVTKFRTCSGWAPQIPLNTTLRDMMEWWRAKLGTDAAQPSAVSSAASERG